MQNFPFKISACSFIAALWSTLVTCVTGCLHSCLVPPVKKD